MAKANGVVTVAKQKAQLARMRDRSLSMVEELARGNAVFRKAFLDDRTPDKKQLHSHTETEIQLGALNEAITQLATDIPDAEEHEGLKTATAWVAKARELAEHLRGVVEEKQQLAYEASKDYIKTDDAATEARNALIVVLCADRMLRLRFPSIRVAENASGVDVPLEEDTLTSVQRAKDRQATAPKRVTVAHTASSTPEERRRATHRALEAYWKRGNSRFPKEIHAIFDSVGFPGAVQTTGEREHAAGKAARKRQEEEDFAAHVSTPMEQARVGQRRSL